MIKKLLLLSVIAFSINVNAQHNKTAKRKIILNLPSNNILNESKTQGSLPSTCYTLSTLSGTAVGVEGILSDTGTPGCSPNAGYLCGTNCYGDLEKANYFAPSTYSTLVSPSITAVKVSFYKNGNMGTGGSNSVTVSMKLYSGTSNTIAPGSAIGATMATMQQILAAQGGTANTLFNYVFNFPVSISVPATGFYASISLPNTPGDSVVVLIEDPAPVNNAWEMGSDANWYDMSQSWTGLLGNLTIYPVVCSNALVSGISKNLGLSKKITLMPNPSNGLVKISVSSPSQENLNISVTNALGQIIHSSSFNGITYDVLPLDLTAQPNGIYFVTVSNGSDKMIQRLIINK